MTLSELSNVPWVWVTGSGMTYHTSPFCRSLKAAKYSKRIHPGDIGDREPCNAPECDATHP